MSSNNLRSYGFWKEIGRRTRAFGDSRFMFHLFFGIVLLGGLGIWTEVVEVILPNKKWSWDGILFALSSYYPALIGAACLQLTLESTRKSNGAMVQFSMGLLIAAIFAGILIRIFEYNDAFPVLTFWGTFLLSAIGILIWGIANCDNPDLTSDPSIASGGDTNRALKGDTSGFKVN